VPASPADIHLLPVLLRFSAIYYYSEGGFTMYTLKESLPDILTPRMIADHLGICYSNALTLVKSGHFSCIRIGNSYKVPKAAFEEWLQKPGLRIVLESR